MPKISVIIPVYNVAKYLPRCLDSLLSQTFTDFEVILIDDKSPDESGLICDDYAQKDKRVIALHTPKGGVSKARNAGLEQACGEYITFVDSDDYVEPYLLDTYARYINRGVDLIKVGYFIEDETGETTPICTPNEICVNTTWDLHYYLEKNRYYSFVWNMCIKRECIGHIKFHDKINWLEDHIFSYQCYFNCKTMVISPKACYHYRTSNSQSRLSFVHDPRVISEASRLEYQLKKSLNSGHYEDLEQETDKAYLYDLHLLVSTLYNDAFPYSTRKAFTHTPLYGLTPIYKEDRIYFHKGVPFFLRDILLLTIKTARKIKYER